MRILATCLLVVGVAVPSRAAIKEIEAKGRYHLGDNDSKLVGHRLALQEAKRNALEKAGTYVQSITVVKDYQLTKDEIRTYSAGIVSIEETRDPEWVLVGRNLEVTVYVKARIDDEDVARKIGVLRNDKEATQELKDARAKVVANEKKIAQLNKELKTSKKGASSTQKKQAAREAAMEDVDNSTLAAQAAVAKRFGIEAYQTTKAYVQRQIPAVKGCYRSAFSSGDQAAAGAMDSGLAWLATPPVVLLVSRCRAVGAGSRGRDRARSRGSGRRPNRVAPAPVAGPQKGTAHSL